MLYSHVISLSWLARFRHKPVITSKKVRHKARHNIMTLENGVFNYFSSCQRADVATILQLPDNTSKTVNNAILALFRTYHYNEPVLPEKRHGRIKTKDIAGYYKKQFKKNINSQSFKKAKYILIKNSFITTHQPKKTIYYYWQSPQHVSKILFKTADKNIKTNESFVKKIKLKDVLPVGLIGMTAYHAINYSIDALGKISFVMPTWYGNISQWLGDATPVVLIASLYALLIQYPKGQTLQNTLFNMSGLSLSTVLFLAYFNHGGLVGNSIYELLAITGLNLKEFILIGAFVCHLHYAEKIGNPYLRLLDKISALIGSVWQDSPVKPLVNNQEMDKLDNILSSHGLKGVKTTQIITNAPVLKTYKLKLSLGFNPKKLESLQHAIKNSLGVKSFSINTATGTPQQAIIQVPKPTRDTVHLKDLLASDEFKSFKGILKTCFCVDVYGKPITVDIAKFPHLLIGAETGGGKSVLLNALLLSLLRSTNVTQLKLTLIDPKRLEFGIYKKIPYLFQPVITEKKQAFGALNKAVKEMERRYKVLERAEVKNISEYNKKSSKIMRYHVIVIDEFGDLVATNKEVTKLLILLAQKSRACGIHIILSTQRPTGEIITGAIRDNMTARIALRVQTNQQSRNIIAQCGAEQLLGNGDGLARLPNSTQLQRIHGAYISTKDIQLFLKKIEDQKKQD